MLTSFALIFLLGLSSGAVFKKLRLPALLGFLLIGILLGPHVWNMLDDTLLSIAPDLRQIALVIILTRAGLSLDIRALQKVGRSALLLCFLPACFEIAGTLLLAPWLLHLSLAESAVLGCVIAAVSPAVVVPRMLKLMEEGYGTAKSIPQMILAGASVDDVLVIVLFAASCSLAADGQISAAVLLQIPVSMITGIILGALTGFIMTLFFRRFHLRDTVKLLILLSLSFLFLALEQWLKGYVPFSGLLAVIALGIFLYKTSLGLAKRLSAKYNKLWVAAEILLFALVGAAVDLRYTQTVGLSVILLLGGALLLRMAGVLLCLVRTQLNWKERLFCMLAYTPKATVQAAIGAIPLSMGLSCGQQVLTAAALSILLTAPLGAICIDRFYPRLLCRTSGHPDTKTV